ncbi:hypothetical protein PFDG_03152 [Plasmodium falciparum Dd2]|uniref:Uncharacterized protein n=1 Tax=Plasmodium falciparum (isolate Dd2) TaxID=57267 RepID=A0A0L7M2R8_PLAF4|nr:hypothetical protein PFDG_03152 [Plasmodium falciparum Dd2]
MNWKNLKMNRIYLSTLIKMFIIKNKSSIF